MCGIIGYVGARASKPLLLAGLQRLEYRGYDSAGIALLEEQGLDYVRAVGNLANLKVAAGPNVSVSTTGLGHTRWATHGTVTEQNAHPLTACDDDKLAIVLNGIVENYRELRDELLAAGHTFSSETDAEVVAHLLEDAYDGDLVAAVRTTVNALKARKQAVGADFLLSLSGFAPSTLHAMVARASLRQIAFNLVVTNVPGPQFPLYCQGARLVEVFPIAFLYEGQQLSIAIFSYCGMLNFGYLVDAEGLSDVDLFAECVNEGLRELVEAALAATRQHAVRPAKRAARTTLPAPVGAA